MKKEVKTKKMTIDKLAIMMNDSFERLEKKIDKEVGELKKDTGELKESNKDIRRDILNLGDKFVSYHTFDSLASRVKVLEQKKK